MLRSDPVFDSVAAGLGSSSRSAVAVLCALCVSDDAKSAVILPALTDFAKGGRRRCLKPTEGSRLFSPIYLCLFPVHSVLNLSRFAPTHHATLTPFKVANDTANAVASAIRVVSINRSPCAPTSSRGALSPAAPCSPAREFPPRETPPARPANKVSSNPVRRRRRTVSRNCHHQSPPIARESVPESPVSPSRQGRSRSRSHPAALAALPTGPVRQSRSAVPPQSVPRFPWRTKHIRKPNCPARRTKSLDARASL
jgi:hypothetical protein